MSIHINPKNKGKFNALKKRTGKTTEQLTHSQNSLTRKRAIFAQNSKHWKHGDGGLVQYPEGGKIKAQTGLEVPEWYTGAANNFIENYYTPNEAYDPNTRIRKSHSMSGRLTQAPYRQNSRYNTSKKRSLSEVLDEPIDTGLQVRDEYKDTTGDKIHNTIADIATGVATWGTGLRRPTKEELEAGRMGGPDRRRMLANAATQGMINELMGGAISKVASIAGKGVANARNLKLKKLNNWLENPPDEVYIDGEGFREPLKTSSNTRTLKSLLDGNILEKQLNKNGEININNIQSYIKNPNTSEADRFLINKVLQEKFPNVSKLNYKEFKSAINNEIVPFDTKTVSNYADYGMNRLGYTNYTTGREFDVNGKRVMPEYPSENKTILFSNKDKFGYGSNTHFPIEENVMAHSRYYVPKEEPNAFNLIELQSDYYQGKPFLKNPTEQSLSYMNDLAQKQIKLKEKAVFDEVSNSWVLPNGDKVSQSVFDHMGRGQMETNTMYSNTLSNYSQKELLSKNHNRRFLQETVDYAVNNGQNTFRFPTRQTAASIEGYSPINPKHPTATPDDLPKWSPKYHPSAEGILKKYDDLIPLSEKTFGVKTNVITDELGNTWNEFKIPQKFLDKKAEIISMGLAAPVVVNKMKNKNKYAIGGSVTANNYFDQRTNSMNSSQQIADAAQILPGVSIFKGIGETGANWLAPKDQYGVSDKSDAAIMAAGFLNPLESTTSVWNDIKGGNFDGKTAAQLLLPGYGSVLQNKENKQQRRLLGVQPEPYSNPGYLPTFPDGGSVTTVYNNIQVPMTDRNVVDKMVELGYHTDRNALLRMTPEQRQALIPKDSPLTWEKVKSGTANQGGYKYYEKNRVNMGTDITKDGKVIMKSPNAAYIKANYPAHTFGYGGIIPNTQPNIEVEGGEQLQGPDGSMMGISDNAPSHAQGGVDVAAQPGTRIFSDKLKASTGRTFAEEADKIRKQLAKYDKILK